MDRVGITIEFYIFEFVYVPNFSLNWQFWFLIPNLPEKGISGLKKKKKEKEKKKKWKSPSNSAYSN